jgi:hypothetical protein
MAIHDEDGEGQANLAVCWAVRRAGRWPMSEDEDGGNLGSERGNGTRRKREAQSLRFPRVSGQAEGDRTSNNDLTHDEEIAENPKGDW